MREETKIISRVDRIPMLIEGLAAAAAVIGLGYYALRGSALLAPEAPKTVAITQPDGSVINVPLIPSDSEEAYQREAKGEVATPTQYTPEEEQLNADINYPSITYPVGTSPDALAGYGYKSGDGGSVGVTPPGGSSSNVSSSNVSSSNVSSSGVTVSGGSSGIIDYVAPINVSSIPSSWTVGVGVSPDALAGYGSASTYKATNLPYGPGIH